MLGWLRSLWSANEISVKELFTLPIDSYTLVDVRESEEYEQVRIAHAQLIPLGELLDRTDEIDISRNVYVICRSGRRSAIAVRQLEEQGIAAVNVAGGTLEWEQSGFPVAHGVAE